MGNFSRSNFAILGPRIDDLKQTYYISSRKSGRSPVSRLLARRSPHRHYIRALNRASWLLPLRFLIPRWKAKKTSASSGTLEARHPRPIAALAAVVLN